MAWHPRYFSQSSAIMPSLPRRRRGKPSQEPSLFAPSRLARQPCQGSAARSVALRPRRSPTHARQASPAGHGIRSGPTQAGAGHALRTPWPRRQFRPASPAPAGRTAYAGWHLVSRKPQVLPAVRRTPCQARLHALRADAVPSTRQAQRRGERCSGYALHANQQQRPASLRKSQPAQSAGEP